MCRGKRKGWQINVPSDVDDELIRTAKSAHMEIADHKPQTMGKAKPVILHCFKLLPFITNSSISSRANEGRARLIALSFPVPRVQTRCRCDHKVVWLIVSIRFRR